MKYLAVLLVFVVGVAAGWLSRPLLTKPTTVQNYNAEPLQAQQSSVTAQTESAIESTAPLEDGQNTIESVDVKVLSYLAHKQIRQLRQFLSEQSYSVQQDVKATIFFYLKDYESDNQQLEKLYLDIYGEDGWWAMWKSEQLLDANKNLLQSAQFGWMALNSGDVTAEMELKLEQVLEMVVLEALSEQLQADPLSQASLLKLRRLFEGLVSYRAANEHFQFGYANLLVVLGELVAAKYYLNALRYSKEYGEKARDLLSIVALSEQGGRKVTLQQYGDHYLVPFFVGGALKANLLLDTGASMTVITPAVLAALPESLYTVVKKAVPFNTANGRVLGDVYNLSQVQVLGYRLDNVNVAVLALSGQKYQGLLGMNVLNLFEFELNQRRGELRLQPKK